MAKEDGSPWPFYIVMRSTDRYYRPHDTYVSALAEAQRLAEKERVPFTLLRVTHKVTPRPVPVELVVEVVL